MMLISWLSLRLTLPFALSYLFVNSPSSDLELEEPTRYYHSQDWLSYCIMKMITQRPSFFRQKNRNPIV